MGWSHYSWVRGIWLVNLQRRDPEEYGDAQETLGFHDAAIYS